MSYIWPKALVTVGDTHRRIAAARLTLTLYLRDPVYWCREGAVLLHDAVVNHAGPAKLDLFRGSGRLGWRRLEPRELGDVRAALVSHTGRARNHLEIQLVDQEPLPTVGLTYHEVSASSPSVGWAQWLLPHTITPERVWELVTWAAEALPVWSAIGGFTLVFAPEAEDGAFRHAFNYSKRYLGLDLQHPERFARHARRGLPSVNWITVVGGPLVERLALDTEALAARQWQSDVTVHRAGNGTVAIRAGALPDIGDLHQMELPAAIAEVNGVLAECLVDEPPTFPGPFGLEENEGSTLQWMRRFVDLEWR